MSNLAYALIFFVAAQACVWWNTRLVARMIAAVNAKRTPDRQIPYALGKRSKTKLIEAEYRQLYPHGSLRIWCSISLTLGLAAFLLTGVMFFKPR